MASGQPLYGTNLLEMDVAEASSIVESSGLCRSYRYVYMSDPTARLGFSEIWCSPPPEGWVFEVGYATDRSVIVLIRSHNVQPKRSQPPGGWGC